MKITFLVGNGFDISVGVKSSYSAFYEWYCKRPSDKEHIAKFKEEIDKDIQKETPAAEKYWADFELGLGQYTEKFTPENASDFIDCFENAQEEIAQYLAEQEEKFDISNLPEEEMARFTDSLLCFYKEVPPQEIIQIDNVLNSYRGEDRKISIVSFNYTNILDCLVGKLQTTSLATWNYDGRTCKCIIDPNLIHVHGTKSAFPILGVNDETQIANKELLAIPQLREVLIKAECVNELGELWHHRAEEQISASKIVCVFGMSLGNTDAKWWRKLMLWLKADGNRHLIIFWYTDNPPNGISTVKQLRCVNEVKDRLATFCDFNQDTLSAVKRRIHVVINTKQFLQVSLKQVEKELIEA